VAPDVKMSATTDTQTDQHHGRIGNRD
jgi:hypothetical protein